MKLKKQLNEVISPFLMAGVLVVLVPIFVFMTLDRMDRQKRFLRSELQARGSALIRTFEAGTRTGMLSMRWGIRRIQAMLQETSFQPGIDYMAITSKTGQILAHSEASLVGRPFEGFPDLSAMEDGEHGFSHRIRDLETGQAYEVYKRFTPLDRGRDDPGMRRQRMGRHFRRMVFPDHQASSGPGRAPMDHPDWGKKKDDPSLFWGREEFYIFAGLSMKQVNRIQKKMLRQTIGTGGILFLVGGAGIISLMFFQAYRSTRASLTSARAFSDNLVQNMPSGLVTIDRNQEITSMNRAARDILGQDLKAPFPQMKEMADEIAASNQPVSREFDLAGGLLGRLFLDMVGSPILDEEQILIGFLFLFRDLTQIRTLKREVETTRRLAAIGKLAAGVAHEIRNPLSSIKGFATYFMKRYEHDPCDVETAQIMVREVERINRSITQLLEFAKPMAVEKKPVDIQKLISHSLRLMERDFEGKSIAVTLDIHTLEKPLITDPDRMNQVLLNLYMNAVHAMGKGGNLGVRVADAVDGKGLEIGVSDNGSGMEKEVKDRIFDPYFTTRPQGTGLGLSIVHRIIENLNGEIRVDTEPGRGTEFKISLPRQDRPCDPSND